MINATNTLKYPDLNTHSNILNLPDETWRDITGFEGYYQVSNLGRIKRLASERQMKNQTTTWMQKFPEIIMKVNNDSKGYPQVRLTAPKARTARVHRLVAEQFLEEPSQELISLCGSRTKVLVNHIDEDKNNAHVNNLEWCSHTYNSMYSISNRKSIKGVETYNSILTDKDVLEIVNCLKLKLYSQTKLAELYNVKQITISNIWTGRSWNHVTGFSVTPRSYKKNIQGKSVSERKESQCV